MKIKQTLFMSALASIFSLVAVALTSNVAMAECGNYGKGNYQKHGKGHMCKHHGSKHDGSKHSCPKHGMKGKGMHGMKYMAEALGLTEDQKTKIAAIKKEKKSVMQSIRKEIHDIRNKLSELDPKSPNYKTEIFSLAAQKGVLVQRMVVEKGEKRFKIASVLTDEQLAKKKEMRKQKKKHSCNHHGKKKGGMHGKQQSKKQCNHHGKQGGHQCGHKGKHQCEHHNKNLKGDTNKAIQEIKKIKEI